MLVAGDFNAHISELEGNARNEEISSVLATLVLQYISRHFLPRQILWAQDGWTWSMQKHIQEVQSWMDYIFRIDHCLFRNVFIRDLGHNTDHYMILGCFQSSTQMEHNCYLWWNMRLPILLPMVISRDDILFAELRRAVFKPPRLISRDIHGLLRKPGASLMPRSTYTETQCRIIHASLIWDNKSG